MKKIYIIPVFCIFYAITTSVSAAIENVHRTIQYFQPDKNIFEYYSGEIKIRLEFCTPAMVRIRITKEDVFQKNEEYMVEKYNWPDLPINQKDKGEYLLFETGKMAIRLYKNPIRVAIFQIDNKTLINEDEFGNSGGFSMTDSSAVCTKRLQPGEHFFGFGERMDYVDRLGTKFQLNVGRGQHKDHRLGAYNINLANYCPVPFFMSNRGYGIFYHSNYANWWDIGASSPETYQFSSEAKELDYYFIYGPDFKDILDYYTQLTGRSPLIPKVAFGLHIGTYSGGTWGWDTFTSQDYVTALARKLRNNSIPADMLHFDSTWRLFGKIGKGATTFEWRKPNFYNPKALIDTLKALNFSYIGLHIRPRIDNATYFNFLDEAQKLGYTAKEKESTGEIIDFFNPEATNWWWNNGLKQMANLGINFIKTDEGSAYGRRAEDSERTGPEGESAHAYHNLFPLVYAKAPYIKFSEFYNTRGYNFTREGYAGIQRYPSIFAGDWPSEWEYFLPIIRAGINIGTSGVGYWTHCMGGFEREADPELYIRWIQFGFFSPLAHIFGMDHPGYKEPWNYGKKALGNFIKYDSLRYTLFPYIYSTAYEMYKTGMPIMRALVLHYRNDTNVYKIDDQYLFGESFMVAPVIEKGITSRKIYLPDGLWYDFWSGNKYQGNQTIEYPCPLHILPLLIKAGSIIPTQPEVQHLNQPVNSYTLDIYPSGKSSFVLYDDDGITNNYKNGIYALTKIESFEEKNKIIIKVHMPFGKYNVPFRSYNLNIHTNIFPKALAISKGKEKRNITNFVFNKETAIISIPNAGNTRETFEIILFK